MALEQDWVPGTLRIEDLQREGTKIIPQPIPTNDPNDPLNWSKTRKALNFTLACFYSLMTFVLLDIGPVIWGDLNIEVGISYPNLYNSWAADTAGLAIGCIFLYPLANKYGRRPIYLCSLLVQLTGAIWFAKMKTNWENLVINAVIGFAGAISETVVQMTIADLFFTHHRASANAVYLLTVTTGTFLAPVAAGYSAASQGWRWIWWWCAILLGTNFVVVAFFFEETKYVPTLTGLSDNGGPSPEYQSHKTGEKKDTSLRTSAEVQRLPSASPLPPRKSYQQRLALTVKADTQLLRHMYQPFIVLATFPAVMYTSLIYGSYLAWYSVCGTTSSIYLLSPPYNFGSIGVGLFSLAPFIGSVLASFYAGPLTDWWILRSAKRNGGIFEPEMRLHLAIPCILVTPTGLLCYGLGLAHGLPWIVLAVGYALFGFTFTVMCDLSLTYVLDCYQDIVGDSLVAVAFIRNGIATAVVFAITPWMEGQGSYDLFVTVGCVATAIVALTIPMIWYGREARRLTATRYKSYAMRQPFSRTFNTT